MNLWCITKTTYGNGLGWRRLGGCIRRVLAGEGFAPIVPEGGVVARDNELHGDALSAVVGVGAGEFKEESVRCRSAK